MYWYESSGKVEFEARDITGELAQKHDGAGFPREALILGGYQQVLSVGAEGIALLEVFFTQDSKADFTGVALLHLGECMEEYAFRETHAGMVFVKEFSPMIAAVLKAHTLAKAL